MATSSKVLISVQHLVKEYNHGAVHALNDCNLLLKLVEISQALGYISVKRMGHWTKLITDVKYMTLAWKKKDTERAKTLRRQEETRDYELQASIIAGAVARALGRR